MNIGHQEIKLDNMGKKNEIKTEEQNCRLIS